MADGDVSFGQANASTGSLEQTPTWAVGVVCIIFIFASFLLEISLKALEQYFKRTHQKPLQRTLEKMKEDVMLLGFISLLLVVTRDSLAKICMPNVLSGFMLPCKDTRRARGSPGPANSTVAHCKAGDVPLMSAESLHQLHMFIFVMAIVHVCYSCMTMILARIQMRRWSHWEDECKERSTRRNKLKVLNQHTFFVDRAGNPWASKTVLSWIDSFFRQFLNPVKKSDYMTLRLGFVRNHNAYPTFNFLNYMMRTMEDDFNTIVRMRAYLWVFVIIFMFLNIHGWYTYFWIVFIPFLLLLALGTKLQHVMTSLALEIANNDGLPGESVKPRDELFWFNKPEVMLHLIHFILFQNAFELAYFSWIWSTYGLHSCFMERRGLVYSRVALGFVSQITCSYTTLPLYALVTQMGSSYKKAFVSPQVTKCLQGWHLKAKQNRRKRVANDPSARVIGNGASNANVHHQSPTDGLEPFTGTKACPRNVYIRCIQETHFSGEVISGSENTVQTERIGSVADSVSLTVLPPQDGLGISACTRQRSLQAAEVHNQDHPSSSVTGSKSCAASEITDSVADYMSVSVETPQ